MTTAKNTRRKTIGTKKKEKEKNTMSWPHTCRMCSNSYLDDCDLSNDDDEANS